MSIIIHGMKMPENYRHMILMANGDVTDIDGAKIANAIELPPHGRLIDADALCDRLLTAWDIADKEKKTLISAVMADVVTPIVVGTPTIIPADKEANNV